MATYCDRQNRELQQPMIAARRQARSTCTVPAGTARGPPFVAEMNMLWPLGQAGEEIVACKG
jgi:hypothetical protein